MDAFTLDDLARQLAESGQPYLEFLRRRTLSCGLYVLPAFSQDRQQPHTEDEVYYVVSGHATISVAGDEQPVGPGSVVFVGANAEHHFQAITEDLVTLVFFAPPQGSRASGPRRRRRRARTRRAAAPADSAG